MGKNRFRTIGVFLRERAWFLISLLLATGICLAPTPPGLTLHGQYTIGLLVMAVICFVSESIPLVATAFLIGAYQVLLGIRDFHDIPKTYMSDSIFFVIGALMMATALVKYDIHHYLALKILERIGNNVRRLVFGMVTIAALTAAFISEHATAAILLPIGVGFVTLCGGKKKVPLFGKLMMISIAYGCMIGSIATPSGGTRNVIMIDYLRAFYNVNIGYAEWMMYVFPLTLILIPMTVFVLGRVFKSEVNVLPSAGTIMRKKREAQGSLRPKEVWVVLHFALTVFFWIFFSKQIGVGQIALISAMLYLVIGAVEWKDYHQGVNWQVVWVYAGSISLGECISNTGLASWMADHFLKLTAAGGIDSGLALLACMSAVAILLTNTMSAGSSIALAGPIFLKISDLAHMSPVVTGSLMTVVSSFAFLVVVGSPASMIIYGSGLLNAKDYLKSGWIMTLLVLTISVLFLAGFYWRLLKL